MENHVSVDSNQRETLQTPVALFTIEHDLLTEAMQLAQSHLDDHAIPQCHRDRILDAYHDRLHKLSQQRTRYHDTLYSRCQDDDG